MLTKVLLTKVFLNKTINITTYVIWKIITLILNDNT